VLSAMILAVLLYGGFGLAGGYVAAHKGRSPVLGILAGMLLAFFTGLYASVVILVVCAAFLPATQAARERALLQQETQKELEYSRQTHPCPDCGRQNSVVTRICPQCGFRFSASNLVASVQKEPV